MAEEILNCDGTDPVKKVDWSNVVGDMTISDGGFFGDLLSITRVHLEDSKNRGELREEDAGVAYGTAIMESMKESIRFELNEKKNQLELCFLQAQIDKLRADIENDACLAAAECALKTAQTLKVEEETLKVTEETALVVEKIESENKHNEDDGIYDQQTYKMIADVEIAKTQVALDQANSIAQIDKVLGYEYTLDADGNIVVGEDSEDGKMDAEVDLIVAQEKEIPLESARRDCTTASQCAVNTQQIEKMVCECDNETNITDSKISLNAANENKLACDCCNSSKIASAQSRLYERQIEGFNDNANQKLYDSQLQAWSMVFADTEMDAVTPSIVDTQICESYERLRNRLAGSWDEDGNFITGAGTACQGSSYTR